MSQNSNVINRFEQLLNDFQRLPPSKEGRKTFLQISGFPHWEIVSSNILEFFFDPTREHELGNVFIRSLLEVYDYDFKSNFAKLDLIFTKTVREEETKEGKQLDLIIIAKPVLVAIENKIRAPVQNPLEVYSSHLEHKARENGIPRKNIIKILLTVKEKRADGKHGFKAITYERLFHQILNNLGHHVLGCEQHYFTFLIDFMNTINNEQKENKMDHELCGFLKQNKHGATSVQFYTRLREFSKRLRSKVNSASEKIQMPHNFTRSFVWGSLQGKGSDEQIHEGLYFKRTLSDGTVVMACASISPEGWNVSAWLEKGNKSDNWLKSKGISETNFGFDEPEDKVAETCNKLLKSIEKLS